MCFILNLCNVLKNYSLPRASPNIHAVVNTRQCTLLYCTRYIQYLCGLLTATSRHIVRYISRMGKATVKTWYRIPEGNYQNNQAIKKCNYLHIKCRFHLNLNRHDIDDILFTSVSLSCSFNNLIHRKDYSTTSCIIPGIWHSVMLRNMLCKYSLRFPDVSMFFAITKANSPENPFNLKIPKLIESIQAWHFQSETSLSILINLLKLRNKYLI